MQATVAGHQPLTDSETAVGFEGMIGTSAVDGRSL